MTTTYRVAYTAQAPTDQSDRAFDFRCAAELEAAALSDEMHASAILREVAAKREEARQLRAKWPLPWKPSPLGHFFDEFDHDEPGIEAVAA
jgi:hypothetical protein